MQISPAAQTPQKQRLRCTVVIPCYNEALRFKAAAFQAFFSSCAEINFLFVNDGSKDATLQKLEELQLSFPDRVGILSYSPNQGKAEAVRRGMQQVLSSGSADVTGFWDADLATPLDEIPGMLEKLNCGQSLEIIFGSRVRLLGHSIERKPARHYLGRCFATAASLVLRLPVYDTQCGAKLFRTTGDFARLLDAPFVSRWIFDVELLARLIQLHGRDTSEVARLICEVPLQCWRDVEGSNVKPTDFFRAFYELMMIHARYLSRGRSQPAHKAQSYS